jgi:hypothetical protein
LKWFRVTWLPADSLERSLFVFSVSDSVTPGGGSVRAVVLGVEVEPGSAGRGLDDRELLRHLNRRPKRSRRDAPAVPFLWSILSFSAKAWRRPRRV